MSLPIVRPVRTLAIALALLGACGGGPPPSGGWESTYANTAHALEQLGMAFNVAEYIYGRDGSGEFEIDAYSVDDVGIRFLNTKSGRFVFVPWDRFERAEYRRVGRELWVEFVQEQIELRYVGQLRRPGRGSEDGSRFFAALRYVSTNRHRLAGRIAAQPIDITQLRQATAEQDCRRTEAVLAQLGELRSVDTHATFAKAQLADWPGAQTAASAHGVWLVTADVYLGACGQRAPIHDQAREGAGPVPMPFIDSAVGNRSCPTLLTVNKLDLWPFAELFTAAIRDRDFAAAEAHRKRWIATFEFLRGTCAGALGGASRAALKSQEDRLRRVGGLGDAAVQQARRELLDALDANDTQAAMELARAVNVRERELVSIDEQLHDARLIAATHMIQARQQTPAPAALTAAEVLALFGL